MVRARRQVPSPHARENQGGDHHQRRDQSPRGLCGWSLLRINAQPTGREAARARDGCALVLAARQREDYPSVWASGGPVRRLIPENRRL
jgi:hypothetical protein